MHEVEQIRYKAVIIEMCLKLTVSRQKNLAMSQLASKGSVAEQQGFRYDASVLKLHSLGLEVIMSSDY